MTDLLRERLQEQVQDVPIHIRGAAAVRRDAERGQRRRRVAAATFVAVLALVVGTSALLGATGDRVAGPPAEQTPTPSVPEVDGAFLDASQLPTVQPFGAWTGSAAAKPGDGPMCLGQWPQATVTARRYTSAEPGRDGYQAILAFPSADDAQSAVANAMGTLFACHTSVGQQDTSLREGGFGGGDGYITRLGGTSADPRSEVVVYTQAGQFVSLLWLAVPGSTSLFSSDVPAQLAQPLTASLRATAERFPESAHNALAAAMLSPTDIPPEVTGAHPDLDTRVDPFGFTQLHPCDIDAAGGAPQRQVTYWGQRNGNGTGQRVIVAPEPVAAQSVFTTLVAGLHGCRNVSGDGARDVYLGADLHLAGVGDEAAGWGYEVRWPAPSGGAVTRVYVAVVRSGRAVMQVAWQGLSGGPDIDAAQFEAVVRAATDRLATGVPDLAESSAAATR